MVLKCAYVMIYMYELRKQMQHSVCFDGQIVYFNIEHPSIINKIKVQHFWEGLENLQNLPQEAEL